MAPSIRSEFLSALHCPYCGSSLTLDSVPTNGEAIDSGILRCACHEYPIVEGIPILQQIEGLDRVVESVKRLEKERALLQALNVFRAKWAHRSRWHQVRYHLNCRRLVSDPTKTFEEAVHLVRAPRSFADYLVQRYANPSFLAAIAPLMMLEDLEKRSGQLASRDDSDSSRLAPHAARVLDLACGAGHASFLIRRLYPGLFLVSADQDFVSLYLAKRFLAPDATQLCWDVEVPSPFPDHYFDGVFCLDAFHYFRSKKAVVAELRRIVATDALWLFPHLHNRLQHNLVAGVPMSPQAYLECFGFPDARLFDETELLRELSQRLVFDTGKARPASQLDQSQTLTWVRSGRDVRRIYEGFRSLLGGNASSLTVNPIYRGRWRRDNLELELTWPNSTMRKECGSAEAILPAKCQLSRKELRQLRGDGSAPDRDRLGDLVARFILVALPRHYVRQELTVC